MATFTLREILGLRYISSIDINTIRTGLQTAKTLNILKNDKNLMNLIDTCLIALDTYILVLEVIELIKSLKPLLNLATKIAAIPFNPAMISELASDTSEMVQALVMENLKTIPDQVINIVMNYPIEI